MLRGVNKLNQTMHNNQDLTRNSMVGNNTPANQGRNSMTVTFNKRNNKKLIPSTEKQYVDKESMSN